MDDSNAIAESGWASIKASARFKIPCSYDSEQEAALMISNSRVNSSDLENRSMILGYLLWWLIIGMQNY